MQVSCSHAEKLVPIVACGGRGRIVGHDCYLFHWEHPRAAQTASGREELGGSWTDVKDQREPAKSSQLGASAKSTLAPEPD